MPGNHKTSHFSASIMSHYRLNSIMGNTCFGAQQVVEMEGGFLLGGGGACNLMGFNRTGKECAKRSIIIL